jgi:hypothetical protein
MHIDRAHQITVASKAASAAGPIAILGLMFMLTARTPARRSSFGAGEARDVSLLSLMREVVDVAAILPLAHALIVVFATIVVADAVGITNEEGTNLVFDTKVDDLSRGFVTQITDTTLIAFAHFILGALQFLPASRVFLTTGLFLGDLSHLLIALPLEGTDTTPGDNESLFGIGGDGSQVDFSQIDGGLVVAWSFFCSWSLNTDMQFKASIPDQGTSACFFWQIKRQDHRLTPFAHGQDHPS